MLQAELKRRLQQPASSWEGAPLHAFAMAPQAPAVGALLEIDRR